MHTASYQKLDTAKTERQEGLGTRLTSQIPPKGVYSSVARESGCGRDPLVVGVALERLKKKFNLQVNARIVITVIYLKILLLQSKQCLRRLNLTSQASHTVLLLLAGTAIARLRHCHGISLRSAQWGPSAAVQHFRHDAAVNGKALLSTRLLQPISITRGKNAAGFTDLYVTCMANICYRHVSTILYSTCILHHCTDP